MIITDDDALSSGPGSAGIRLSSGNTAGPGRTGFTVRVRVLARGPAMALRLQVVLVRSSS